MFFFSVLHFQLAEVARTPWLDPYVAGGILAAKALSEGDWRIGKGALAGWADRALSSLSNTGAKVLRVGSGNEVRRTTRTPIHPPHVLQPLRHAPLLPPRLP